MKPVALLLCLATPALANDGFGGFSATGLTFSQTEAGAVESEELFIGTAAIPAAPATGAAPDPPPRA